MAHEAVNIRDICPNLDKPWWRTPHLLKLNALLMVPFFSSYVSGYDGSMVNGIQTLPQWQEYFNYPKGGILGLLVTIQIIGAVVSLPLAPIAADKLGRRPPLVIGSLVVILGAGIQSGARNLTMFMMGRFCLGLGGGIGATSASPLLAELAYPTHRAIYTALYNTTWYVGAIVAAWVTYDTYKMPNTWSWRIPSILQVVFSIIQLLFIYWVPESPRWLIANDRIEEATNILCKYHAGSEEPNELVRFEVAEITTALQLEQHQKSASYMHFFKTKGNRHRLFIAVILGFIIQWCGTNLVSFYLALVLKSIGITSPETQNLINGILQIFNFVVAVLASCLVDRLGRRFLFLTSTTGMMISFIIWTALSARHEMQNLENQNKSLGLGVVVMVFIFFAFYNIAMMPLPTTYMVEVLPYTLRAKGISIFNLAQFCSSIFNGFVNPIALEAIGWKYYTVFACALALWLVVIFFTFPETRGMSLEEVSRVFDNGHDQDPKVAETAGDDAEAKGPRAYEVEHADTGRGHVL